MEFIDFKKLIKNKKGTIFSLSFLLVVIVMLVSLLSPLKYTAKSRVLVIQNAGSADAYSVSRSNEYLGNLFSQVAYSGSFFTAVLNSRYSIDSSYFSSEYSERIKLWRKTVSTKTFADTGIIEINVFHVNRDQARLISLAVNDVLINQNSDYQGGQGVKISVLDQPVVSDYPDKPNLFFNLIFSLAVALFISLIYIYLFPESKYDIRLWPTKRKKKILVVKNNLEIKARETGDNRKSVRVETDFAPKKIVEEEIKEEMFKKDVFEPNGDIGSVLR